MAEKWTSQLNSAHKTCIVQEGRRKIHYTFADGTEMAEEYDQRSGDLIIRKWRRKGTFGSKGTSWDFEVGEQLMSKTLDPEGLVESSSNPIFVRKDTKVAFQWRIRNIPYPLHVFSVTVQDDNHKLIIKTSNKKYYKKFSIPDMERVGCLLTQDSISTAHANNTFIITYKKPKEVLEMEKKIAAEMKQLKASKDGDVDCTPS
ncbi:protein DPCD-like isoform X1 [Mizuhopecten yessoensis]|uniref:protein DPCD-like isoform X1 n=1 Tax=Mizuhopecten yessoensis TaxID=6573 RepID=UPI000B45A049|nr:protein DPCD-like isoform X1 [Mizuhopecten yessoensis]